MRGAPMFNPFRRAPSFHDLRTEARALAQSIPARTMAEVDYDDGTTEVILYTEAELRCIDDAMADALDGGVSRRKARKIINEAVDRLKSAPKQAGGSHA
jgi:hypothetical protein